MTRVRGFARRCREALPPLGGQATGNHRSSRLIITCRNQYRCKSGGWLGRRGTSESRRLATRACMVVITAGAQCQVGRGCHVPLSPEASSFSITPGPFRSPHMMLTDGRTSPLRPPRLPVQAPKLRVSDPLHTLTQKIKPSCRVSHVPPPHASAVLFKDGGQTARTRDHGPSVFDMSQQRHNGIGCRLQEHIQQ